MMRCFAAWTAVLPNSAKSTGISIWSPIWKSGSSKRASSSEIWLAGSVTSSTTVLRSTIRIAPLFSSISTSACTVGPCFLARAALMPSSRSPCNSARSICFELVNSRIAVRISTEAAIFEPLPFPVKRQPRLLDRGKRKAPLMAALVSYDHNFLSGISFDTSNLHFVRSTARRIAHHVGGDYRAAADELSPILCVPQRPFDPRRRYLQHVSLAGKIIRIQPGLDRTRCCRAIVDRDLLTVLALDTNIDNG